MDFQLRERMRNSFGQFCPLLCLVKNDSFIVDGIMLFVNSASVFVNSK